MLEARSPWPLLMTRRAATSDGSSSWTERFSAILRFRRCGISEISQISRGQFLQLVKGTRAMEEKPAPIGKVSRTPYRRNCNIAEVRNQKYGLGMEVWDFVDGDNLGRL